MTGFCIFDSCCQYTVNLEKLAMSSLDDVRLIKEQNKFDPSPIKPRQTNLEMELGFFFSLDFLFFSFFSVIDFSRKWQ